MIIDPVPPIHDINIVVEDNCNNCCFPWRRKKESPEKDKIQEVAKEIISQKDKCEG